MPFGTTHFTIDDETPLEQITAGGRGLVPRDYQAQPLGSLSGGKVGLEAVNIPVIPKADRWAMAKELEDRKARLSDIRRAGNGGKPIPALDQGQVGYCWAHSGTMGLMLQRAAMGLPYVPLSAYAVAATIKQGRDEGGWGAQGVEFLMKYGAPSQDLWPQGDRNYRQRQTDAMKANAALHRLTAQVADLDAPVYSRDLSDDQVETLLLLRVPVVFDLNWWAHSTIFMDLVPLPGGELGRRGLNSWGDGWGDMGEFVLRGERMRPDGAVGLLAATASAA